MRPNHHNLIALAALAASLAFPRVAASVTFTRITDPSNPIVNDATRSGGGSWIDLVGDGYLDLFVANGNLSSQPNALYRNTRAGGFVKVVTGSVITDGGSSIGGTFGDFDNDGLPDLFVTNRSSFGNFLYRGLGDTTFAKITTGPPVTNITDSNMSSWVDLDNDGNLDLYVVNFNGNDYLFHSDGPPSYTFTRIDTTIVTPGAEFSIPGAWTDFNSDGFDDLFVGNAGTQNDYLWINHGHLFFTKQTFTDAKSTLGCSWGDYDNDGWPDLFVAHYPSQKNTLYHNSGPPSFNLVAVDTSIVSNETGSWVGSSWGDVDNDGDLDLYVANDGASGSLYLNSGAPAYFFTKATGAVGSLATDVGNAFGTVFGDYDRDGQLDLFVTDYQAHKNRLYHNDGTVNHWLTIRGRGTASNRSAIGAKVRVLATIAGVPTWQLREITGQTGYNSQNLDQHFGLGSSTVADSIRINWPSGAIDTFTGVAADTFLVLVEGASAVSVEPGRPIDATGLRLEQARPNPCQGTTTLAFTLPREGRARLEVYDVRGRRVAGVLDARLAAGRHEAKFVAPPGSPAGVYFCRLATATGTRVTRLVLTR